MKKTYIMMFACVLVFALSSCSEDDPTADPTLTQTMFDTEDSNPEIKAANDSLMEKYGSKVFYQFDLAQFKLDWTSNYSRYTYVAVPEGSEQQVLRMIRFIKDDVFASYPSQMVKRYLPSRIFLADSVLRSGSYRAYEELPTHAVAISGIGPGLDSWRSSNWTTLQTNMVTSMLSAIYDNNKSELSEFMSAKDASNYTIRYDTYTKSGYVFPDDWGSTRAKQLLYNVYMAGYTNTKGGFWDNMGMCPRWSDSDDLGNFINFITGTGKSRFDYLFFTLDDFPRLRRRTYLLALFLQDTLDLDPMVMQNEQCPDDPVPAGYFDTLNQ